MLARRRVYAFRQFTAFAPPLDLLEATGLDQPVELGRLLGRGSQYAREILVWASSALCLGLRSSAPCSFVVLTIVVRPVAPITVETHLSHLDCGDIGNYLSVTSRLY
ncbi:hypothetical protein GCM10025298_16120 [Natronobiforma cellulositropha]